MLANLYGADLWTRVETLLACPKCGAPVANDVGRVTCTRGHAFRSDSGLLSFSKKKIKDKYDEDDMATRYVQYAFGSQVVRGDNVPDGRSEGLYRAVSDICRGELLAKGHASPVVVDLACGVGRTVYDIASVHDGSIVLGFDLSTVLARCAATICSGNVVPCGADQDGWPIVDLTKLALSNVFVAQADACAPPLRKVANGSPGAAVVLLNMLIDRLRTPEEVEASLSSALGIIAPGGLLLVTTPFNWISEDTWRRYGLSRTWLLDALRGFGLTIEIAFDQLRYSECLDPFGTTLELPVQVCAARKGERI